MPHGFRAAFSTIMNEWAERESKERDSKIIDLMLAHVPTGKVGGPYDTAAYVPRRRELAMIWSDMLSDGPPDPTILIGRALKVIGEQSRRHLPDPVETDFRFPAQGGLTPNVNSGHGDYGSENLT